MTALKSNSNTVWFNFQTYIIFSINLVSFKVTLRSSGTDILYGCHLLLDVCIYIYIYIYIYIGVDVVEWSRALDVRLSEWCCSVSMVWVQIPSREEQNLTALKSNSNTVWFNFQTYIIFSINLVSFKVTLRSSGTDILYGCHLLLDVCIYIYIYIYIYIGSGCSRVV